MADEYFPIQTETACKSKWAWSTIWFYDGTTASCHRCDRHKIDIDDFDNFHNTPSKIEQREAMLKGQWPSSGGCDYCQKTEAAGGQSDRQFHNSIPNQTPAEVIQDQTVTSCTPTILEIFLDNACNLSCIYCRPANSSKIEVEFNKFGPFKVGDVYDRLNYKTVTTKIDIAQELKVKFWDWMTRNSGALRRFHVLGGEPMFQKEFQQCLDHWWDYPNPNVELNIVSNLMVPEKRFKQYIDYIKKLYDNGKIKRFDLTASIDCWGEPAEYIRTGLKLDMFEKNMQYLLEQDESWLRLNINQTITCLGIKTMPALIEKIKVWKSQRKEFGHYFQLSQGPDLLAVINFPHKFFAADFKAIMDALPNETWDDKHAYDMMQGLIKQVEFESECIPEEIDNLVMYLNELDERRGTTWRATFPWLHDFITA